MTSRTQTSSMLFGVVTAGLMVLVAGLMPYQAAKRFAEANDNLKHQYVTLGALDSMQRGLPTAIAELRGYAMSGDTVLLDAYRAAMAAMHENEARAARLLEDEPEILASFQSLQQLLREREANLAIAESVAAGGAAAVLSAVNRELARKQTAAVNEAFASLRSQLDGYIAERESALDKAYHRLQLMLALFLVASLAVLALLYRIAIRTRARRNAALAEAEAQRRISDSIIDNAPLAIYLRNASDQTLIRTNPKWTALRGSLGNGAIEGALLQEERKLLESGQWVANGEYELNAEEGASIIQTRTVLIPDLTGNVRYILRLIDDVTESRKAERAEREFAATLQQKSQALEMANKELESFSYSVSHDLRAPLRAIEGYAAILAEDNAAQLDDSGRRYLQNIRDGATRMGVLIQDLLAFSRLNRQALMPTDCDTQALVQGAWQSVRTAHPDRQAQLTVLDLPHCRGDAHLLQQVWVNLLDNAAKYSSKTPEPRITVRAEASEDGREMLFHVEDNGAGFDMRYYDKLFNVFQRLHGESQFPGTGVGLAIVQRIVVRHGGRVFARGEPGKGACFSFALPLGSPT